MKLLEKFQKKFNQEIKFYLEKKEKEFEKLDKKASFLIKIIKEFIERGGKRFRPALFYYAYSSYSKEKLEEIFRLSFVFELFHTFALIHDDIIDNSDSRRNKQTIHKKYDLPTAILVGDLSLMLADELFFDGLENLKLASERQRKVIDLYNQFKQEVLLGEYLDCKKIDDVYKIMELKTARYSFIRPVTIGLSLAIGEEKEIIRWKKILREIGILFQIKDDFVGTFGDEKSIGKPTDSDIKEGKNTLIVKKFLERCTAKEKIKFLSFFGKRQINKENFLWYKNILFKLGIFNELKHQTIEKAKKIDKKLNLCFSKKPLTKLLKKILIQYFNV